MTCTTLIIKTSWKDGHETIDTIVYTAEEMAGIFLPHERDARSSEEARFGRHGPPVRLVTRGSAGSDQVLAG